jgi:hypothetical protein
MTIKTYRIFTDIYITVEDHHASFIIWELLQSTVAMVKDGMGYMEGGFKLEEIKSNIELDDDYG